MSNVTRDYAPYAAPKNVLDFIRRRRERGLPEVVGPEVLQQIGVPSGNVPRTLRALRFLGLIGEDSRRTGLLDRIGAATAEEYRKSLAEMVRAAYRPVFAIVDPTLDSPDVITDAFRRYQPDSQRSRMVALFLALCREAGLTGRKVGRPTAQVGIRPNARSRNTPAPTAAARSSSPSVTLPGSFSEVEPPSFDYGIVSALVQQLPASARWSKQKRQKWFQAIASAVDLMVEVVDE
ncbi:MAG: DUF5343 domain-containing protein [Chloroflexi bacterium]|nr:DUF5343 domain-containing protein [Chloroflexota bacterium]